MLTVVHRRVRRSPKEFSRISILGRILAQTPSKFQSGVMAGLAAPGLDPGGHRRLLPPYPPQHAGEGREGVARKTWMGPPATIPGSSPGAGMTVERWASSSERDLELDPEKWEPVFGKDHAPTGLPSHSFGVKKTRRHGAAGLCLSCVQDQFGSVADFGFGGNAALVLVPRRRSNAIVSALSSLASGGT